MTKSMIFWCSVCFSTMTMALPNPSAVYCFKKGGTYETRVDSAGNQDGVCIFNQDGTISECGGWAFFRGVCAPGECARWSIEINACLGDAEIH